MNKKTLWQLIFYLQHVLQTIIYFMKIQFQNIYFENTPPPTPCRLSGGPLMPNHRMFSLAIIRAHKDTT